MDPISHLLVTRLLVGSRPVDLVAGLAPDLPWYLLYPAWLVRSGQAREALSSGDWPMPPETIKRAHYVSHSLLTLALLWLLAKLARHDTHWAWSWLLHLLLDIPTHSRERMAPRPLYPLSDWSHDGFSWADGLTWVLMRLRRLFTRRQGASQP